MEQKNCSRLKEFRQLRLENLDYRQMQFYDEDKQCGIQPAYIRVIDRRLFTNVLT